MQAQFAENLISPAAADRLIAAHDGDLALLYLFIQRSGSMDLERAACELCRTLGEMEAAYEKLMRMGLVSQGDSCAIAPRPAPVKKILPEDEVPEYTTADVVSRMQGDNAFAAVLHEAEQIFGKRLSSPDLKKLFGIYDHYGLPAEVLMVMMHHCVEISSGRLPTLRFMERQACIWANREIMSLEQAEEYIDFYKRRREDSCKVAEALGRGGRKLSPTEDKYISAWLDMGFGLDAIELAYDRTVTNTGDLKWSYMNRILESWKEKGLFDVAEIEEKDSRRKVNNRPGKDKTVDFSGLDAMLDEM